MRDTADEAAAKMKEGMGDAKQKASDAADWAKEKMSTSGAPLNEKSTSAAEKARGWVLFLRSAGIRRRGPDGGGESQRKQRPRSSLTSRPLSSS